MTADGMRLRFRLTLESAWPPLAWIAKCERSDPVITVRHGPQVEVREGWFCEAVWDGEFASGGFDQTDLVFGSGARLRNGRAVFVSSGTTVDRLQFLELGDTIWISNSLACLLGTSGVKVDRTYDRYFDFFWSITRGLNGYERRLPTTTGRLEFVFFHNLIWDGEKLAEEDKPHPVREMGSFPEYREFLEASLAGIAANMQATERNHRYRMVSGLSSGYDSTTATVLAMKVGLERVFSFRTARGGAQDHGEEMARWLGLELALVGRTDWRGEPFTEIPYLAVNGAGQDIVFSSARELLRGQVLVSGFHGDGVWEKGTNGLAPDLARDADGGLSFTEHRLQLGCIHLPVPYLGARQIQDLNALSNSPELAAWDIPGDYSRPICRRIVEDAGIPRDAFGMHKKAATNHFRRGEAVLTEETRVAYYGWLQRHERLWRQGQVKGTKPPGRIFWAFYVRYAHVGRVLRAHPRLLPGKPGEWVLRAGYKFYRRLNRRINLVEHLFPWAIEELAKVYVSNEAPGDDGRA
ncbi:MAG: hypothetical protein KAJ43_12300 [Gemmatimonadetes bacterium]|nr:hypothetical protein [Gemmatimonadota bacterium]